MPHIHLRYQRVSDAKRFLEILQHEKFKYFPRSKNLRDEITYLKKMDQRRKKHIEYSYAILFEGKVVGGCGIKIDQHRTYIGEIGYFVAQEYWGLGIATKAVQELENIGRSMLNLRRIIIQVTPKNKASIRVALKCGYKKEGILRKVVHPRNKYLDAYLFAKVK